MDDSDGQNGSPPPLPHQKNGVALVIKETLDLIKSHDMKRQSQQAHTPNG